MSFALMTNTQKYFGPVAIKRPFFTVRYIAVQAGNVSTLRLSFLQCFQKQSLKCLRLTQQPLQEPKREIEREEKHRMLITVF